VSQAPRAVRTARTAYSSAARLEKIEDDAGVNAYEQLEAAVVALADQHPTIAIGMRPLHGTRDVGDHLIVERAVGDGVRVVRIPATLDRVCSFYWGDLPAPGRPYSETHGEGHRYGNLVYVLSFVRAFLFELEDWRTIPDRMVDGSPDSR
jgi:hypothetical protein